MNYFLPIFVGLTITLTGGVLLASTHGYSPLVTLPGVTTVGTAVGMGEYLAGMMKFIVAIAGVFAIIVAIIGGTQYVAAGISPNAKGDAKDRILNAFIGLALVLTSYLILNSINPKLVAFNLTLPSITGPATDTTVAGTGTPTNTQGVSVAGCSSCVITAGLFPQKSPGYGCLAGNACQIDRGVAEELVALNRGLTASNINWQATELWPPTRAHNDPCHQAGTCIDAALRGNSLTSSGIKTFIEEASRAGLRAVYEVPSERRKNELVAAGVPASSILNLGSWISGEHFSVYNN